MWTIRLWITRSEKSVILRDCSSVSSQMNAVRTSIRSFGQGPWNSPRKRSGAFCLMSNSSPDLPGCQARKESGAVKLSHGSCRF